MESRAKEWLDEERIIVISLWFLGGRCVFWGSACNTINWYCKKHHSLCVDTDNICCSRSFAEYFLKQTYKLQTSHVLLFNKIMPDVHMHTLQRYGLCVVCMFVCVYVGHNCEPYKNRWTNQAAVCGLRPTPSDLRNPVLGGTLILPR